MERKFEEISTDLWKTLQKTNKPTVLYGMGNGGDKILAVCAEKGIKIDGVFASDGFSRGQRFHGMPVQTYGDFKRKFGTDFRVLLAFGTSREDVLANILKIDSEVELYAPDLPVFGEGVFDSDCFNAHLAEINEAYSLFSDDESKRIFEKVIEYKLTGRIAPLFEAESDPTATMREIVQPEKIGNFADLGAYRGETVKELLDAGAKPETVFAFEPDARNYQKTLAYANEEKRTSVRAIEAAAWCENTVLRFDATGNRNASIEENLSQVVGSRVKPPKEVQALTLDSVVGNTKIDYIKYDVEGSESEALAGSFSTVNRFRPLLKVALYHRTCDLFELPLSLHRTFPFYHSFFLRRLRGIPAWDLDLYCR